MAKLRITYFKSVIGYSKDQKDTVRSLGLRKLNSTVVHNDTPAIRGMVFKVRHLVRAEEVDDATPTTAAEKASRAAAPAPAQRAAARPAVAPAEPEAPPAATRASTAAPARQTVVLSDATAPAAPAADDLTIIEGIGPKIASVLQAAGITSLTELAATDVGQLEEILTAAKLPLASPETWPEQAQLAAAGDLDGLKQLQDQLKGGRREEG